MREAIELLKREALLRRNAAILKAKRDYYHELGVIKRIGRSAGLCMPGRPRKPVVTENPMLKATTVARDILLEGHVMNAMELAREAQRRGCRSADDTARVAQAIRGGLRYYSRYIRKDDEGRWSAVS